MLPDCAPVRARVAGRWLGRRVIDRPVVDRALVDASRRICAGIADDIAVHVPLVGNARLRQRRRAAGKQA